MIFVYSEEELEQLLCGRPDISIQELRESAQYKGGWSKDDEQIKWLWAFLGTCKKTHFSRWIRLTRVKLWRHNIVSVSHDLMRLYFARVLI